MQANRLLDLFSNSSVSKPVVPRGRGRPLVDSCAPSASRCADDSAAAWA
ncbi:MAG: hypothetical protein ACLTMP_02190 [Eggerthella lenta]